MNYQEMLNKAEALELEASGYRLLAEEKHKKETKKKGIESWLGYHFQSSSGLTEEFALFSKQIKRVLKNGISGYELISYSRGHFFFSAFLKNKENGKIVYLSSDDVRYSPDAWFNNLLIRTAKHDKDFTGGSNDHCKLSNIREKAEYLTK